MKCPACGGGKASAAKMERGFQILCPCGYANTRASIPQEQKAVAPVEARTPVEESPAFIPEEPEPLEVFYDIEITEEEEE